MLPAVGSNCNYSHEFGTGNYDNTYSPEVEWANLHYQVNDNFSIRAGRTRQSVFMFADSRKVGYTYPWVRLPSELYGLVPVTRNDGVELSDSRRWGEARNTLTFSYGSIDFDSPGLAEDGEGSARHTVAVMNRLEYGDLTWVASYHRTDLTIPGLIKPFEAFKAFGAQGQAIAAHYSVDGVFTDYFGMGLNYDPGHWFAVGEWARTRSESVLEKARAWYVSVGVRLGSVVPYILHARHDAQGDGNFMS